MLASNVVVGRSRCPKCASQGNDTRADNLVSYLDGHSHCYACGSTYNASIKNLFQELPKSSRIAKWKLFELPTLEAYDIRVDIRNRILIPWLAGSQVSAVKIRDESKPTNNRSWPIIGVLPPFFGSHLFNSANICILCEGETDVMAFHAALTAESITQYKPLGVGGCDRVTRVLREQAQWLRNTFQYFILAFDNDEAGKIATQKAIELLPQGKVGVAHFSGKDVYEAYESAANLIEVLTNTRPLIPDYFWEKSELVQSSLSHLSGGLSNGSWGFPGVDYLLCGVEPGAMIGLCGDTGVGKTTFSLCLVSEYLRANPGKNVLYIPLEMTGQQILLKLLEIELDWPILDTFAEKYPYPQKIESLAHELADRLIIYRGHGELSEDFSEICDVGRVQNASLVVFDHITAVATTGTGTDWSLIDSMAWKIKQTLLAYNMTGLIISHITLPKDRDVSNGAAEIRLSDLRGGRGFGQACDTVLGLLRDRNSTDFTLTSIKPNRMVSRPGNVRFFRNNVRCYEFDGVTNED